MEDYKQLLINVGLPCVSATKNGITGNIDAAFERSLSGDEWELYLKTIKPPTWESIRGERVKLLSACDWTQLPDAPLTDNERLAWQQYRQALRDLPQTYQSPDDVIFPEVAQG